MVTAVIVGAGHRALEYAKYAGIAPDRLKIVGVADPNPERRAAVAKIYDLPPERCFESAAALVAAGKIADAVINGTMDRDHVPTTVPLLEAGYDVLLEKPFAVSVEELRLLEKTAKATGRRVMICHVLRYAPFYAEIRRRVANGDIGEIIDVQTAEHVSYHHYSMGFVRGKWRRVDLGGSSFLMSKCCHDLDLISWFKSGVKPVKVASFGGRRYFTREKAPANSGEHCLLDCPIEKDCPYSVRKLHLDHPDRWTFYVWPELDHRAEASPAEKEAVLRDPANPYSKCVWKLDNDLLDRQTVIVEFADGAVASHQAIGGCSSPMRKIHLIGTTGEIFGVFEDNQFTIRHIDTRPGCEYREETFNLADLGDTSGAFGGHGGGDIRLAADFVALVNGEPGSISRTLLDDSISGHLIGFAADRAVSENRVVELDQLM